MKGPIVGQRVRLSTTACSTEHAGTVRDYSRITIVVEFDEMPGILQEIPRSQIVTLKFI